MLYWISGSHVIQLRLIYDGAELFSKCQVFARTALRPSLYET